MKIYEVSENLKRYTTTLKDRKYGLIKIPEDEHRLYQEELKGSEDEEEEKEVKVYAPENIESTMISESAIDIPDPDDDATFKYAEAEDFDLSNSRISIKDIDPELLKDEF